MRFGDRVAGRDMAPGHCSHSGLQWVRMTSKHYQMCYVLGTSVWGSFNAAVAGKENLAGCPGTTGKMLSRNHPAHEIVPSYENRNWFDQRETRLRTPPNKLPASKQLLKECWDLERRLMLLWPKRTRLYPEEQQKLVALVTWHWFCRHEGCVIQRVAEACVSGL